jgi:hypothetical protein
MCADVCAHVILRKRGNERTLIISLFFSILFAKCGGIFATDETRECGISTVLPQHVLYHASCAFVCARKQTTYGTQRKAFSRRSWDHRAHFTVDIFARNSDDCIPD